jgi:MoaA/NifB/PqqE/SkfB family radical SAM enzyme
MKTKAFIITSSCERSCRYCIIEKRKDMSFSEFKLELDNEIKKNPLLTKVYISGGNAELNKDFFSMCEYVKSKKLKLKISGIYSNKINMNKYLKLVDEVSIALDSLDENINDYFRGLGSYKLSMDAFNFFKENKIAIQIHTVVNSKNIKEIDGFYEYLKEINFFKNNSWKLFRYTSFKKDKYSIDENDWNKIKEIKDKKVLFVDKFEE